MSKGTRDEAACRDRKPGPGQYAVGSSFGGNGRTMGGRTENGGFLGKNKNTPGPG